MSNFAPHLYASSAPQPFTSAMARFLVLSGVSAFIFQNVSSIAKQGAGSMLSAGAGLDIARIVFWLMLLALATFIMGAYTDYKVSLGEFENRRKEYYNSLAMQQSILDVMLGITELIHEEQSTKLSELRAKALAWASVGRRGDEVLLSNSWFSTEYAMVEMPTFSALFTLCLRFFWRYLLPALLGAYTVILVGQHIIGAA
ncbi:hypothetical protein [Pseudaquabacterium rugosum]|uniref:SMODS and SLOG-associating 2TM effector domain-containing protein n=1 Tax=Pseudaquabacterium rugosum TaxID=2984194 RepID=A0ABU9BGF1_9BURK